MTTGRSISTAAAVLLLVALGIAIGIAIAPRVDGIWVTGRFVSDRMAECARTVRFHEAATAARNDALQQLVSGDLRQCRLLVSMHAAKIAGRDRDTAARIIAASPDPLASR